MYFEFGKVTIIMLRYADLGVSEGCRLVFGILNSILFYKILPSYK